MMIGIIIICDNGNDDANGDSGNGDSVNDNAYDGEIMEMRIRIAILY